MVAADASAGAVGASVGSSDAHDTNFGAPDAARHQLRKNGEAPLQNPGNTRAPDAPTPGFPELVLPSRGMCSRELVARRLVRFGPRPGVRNSRSTHHTRNSLSLSLALSHLVALAVALTRTLVRHAFGVEIARRLLEL